MAVFALCVSLGLLSACASIGHGEAGQRIEPKRYGTRPPAAGTVASAPPTRSAPVQGHPGPPPPPRDRGSAGRYRAEEDKEVVVTGLRGMLVEQKIAPEPLAPVVAAPDVPATPSAREKVTDALEALDSANFAFNAPTQLQLNQTAQIELRVSLAESIEQLKASISAAGERIGGEVKISDRIEARLSGLNFEIQAVSDEIQPLGVNDTVGWTWDVKPTVEGNQVLHLTLTAIITVDGKDMKRTVRTLDRKISVEVSAVSRAATLFGKYWQWLMTAVFIPLFGWGVKKFRGKPREPALAAT